LGPLFLLILGAYLARWRARLGYSIMTAATLVTLLLALPAVADWLQWPFEWAAPPYAGGPSGDGAGAIVVLGAGRHLGALEYSGAAPDAETLESVRLGAQLARRTGLPVLVTGGAIGAGKVTEAQLMAETLSTDFGVAVRWQEDGALDTRQNAINSVRLLQRDHVSRVILVTDVVHMPRSAHDFNALGLAVVPAPANFRAGAPHSILDWIPSAPAYARSAYVLRECLGLVWTLSTEGV